MSLTQFDIALSQTKKYQDDQIKDIESQIEHHLNVSLKANPKMKDLVMKKINILQDEKLYWDELRGTANIISAKIAQDVEMLVSSAIRDL